MFQTLSWRNRLTLWASAVLLALIVIVGILSLTHFSSLVRSATPQADFGTYYLGGAILESPNPNELFSMKRLEQEAEKRGMSDFVKEGATGPYNYPPFLAVLMRPISRLPFFVAQTGWLWFNILLILASIPPLVAWNASRRTGIGIYLVALLVVTLYTPGHSALMLGQISPLMFFATSWAFGLLANKTWAKHHAAQIAAGGLIGLATIIKLYPILLVALLLWKRQLRVVGWTIISLVAYTIIGILGGGLSNTIQFFASFLPSFYGERVYHALLNNQSFSATFARWMGQSPFVPFLSLLCSGIILGVTCAALVRSRRAAPDDEHFALEYGLVLTMSILVLTYVTLNYYLLLLVSLSALWFSPKTVSPPLRVFAVLGSMALVCVHVMSLAILALGNVGDILPFGLIAVLVLWGGLVARVGWASQPRALEAQA
jgi:Glycosyltransferase family 87